MRKIKQISLTLIIVFCTISGRAQETIISSSFNPDTVFSLLDVSLMPNGILIDRLADEGSIGHFDGSCNDCHTNDNSFRQFMLNLQTCRFANNTFLIDYDDVYKNYLEQNKAVPIQIVNVLYDKIRNDAFSENLLQVTDSLLDEGSNTSESPYDSYRFLAIRVADDMILQGISFTIDSNFYLTNDSNFTISKIEIDFGDGLGFIEVNFGQTISPDYSEFSEEDLEIKLRLTSGSSTYSAIYRKSSVNCDGVVPSPVAPPWATASQFQYGNIVATRTNNANGLGHAVGNAYVYYRDNPEPGTENLFKKPIIIVEGIDFGRYTQQNAANYLMGSFGWCALWGQDLKNYGQLAKMPQLLNEYHDNGYDIIMLDFKNGSTDIRENAFLLQELIEKVNQYKTQNAEQNVVLGASMGAIVARYALADMEQEGKEHCTRLCISFDGPHQGANIPLGAQYFINFFANNGVNERQQAKDMWASLNTTAAKQLLIKQFSPDREAFHTAFFNELTILGYPQKCVNVAIANGTINGLNQGYNGGAQIVSYNHTINNFWNIHVRGNIWSQPGRSSDNLIFYGVMPWKKTSWINVAWGKQTDPKYGDPTTPHYDNAPGGVRQFALEIAGIDTDGYGIIQSLWNDQAFIPSISALDVSTSNLFVNIEAALDNGTITTPFDAYYGPTAINTFHVEATNGTPVERGDNINFTYTKTNISAGLSNTALSSVYNYGVLENNLVHHTEVLNNGKLHLYGDLPDGVTNTTPTSGNTQEYYIGSDCIESELEIKNGGELILGDANKGNIAIFYVSSNSSLILSGGGKIKINNGSKLIIEDGANFTFLDGAQIELQGPNSILEIRGKVTIGDNATFTFSGEGRIVIDQFIYKGVRDNFWDIGENTSFILEGSTLFGQVMLECKSNFTPIMESDHTFDLVKIHKGKIFLHPAKHMSITSPFDLKYVEVNVAPGNSSFIFHGGIKLWGEHNNETFISYNKFYNGTFGILANQTVISNPELLKISNNLFEDNIYGMYVSGQTFSASYNTFNNNSYGVYGTELHGTCDISRSTFANNDVGCFLSGQGGSETKIFKNEFHATQLYASNSSVFSSGIILEDYSVNLTCNTFDNLHYGVYFPSYSASVDLSEDSKNSFSDIDFAIYGDIDNGYFNMLNGENSFTHSNAQGSKIRIYVQNNLSGPGAQHNGSLIDFSNNRMPNIFFQPNVDVSSANFQGAFTPSSNVQFPFSVCVDAVEFPFINEVREVQNMESGIYVAGGGNLIEKTIEAGEKITNSNELSEIREDAEAFQDLMIIANDLIPQYSQLTASDKLVFFLVLRMMEKALHQHYKQELFAYNTDYYATPQQEIIDLNNMIDQFRDSLGTPADTMEYERETLMELTKIHNLRQGGYLQQANSAFDNFTPGNIGSKLTERWQYWNCIINVEAMFMQELIDQEAFESDMSECITSFAPRMSNILEINDDLQEANHFDFKLDLYPNPTSDFLYFRTPGIEDPETPIEISVYNLTGIKVHQDFTQASFLQRIHVEGLASGMYILKVQAKGVIKTQKFLIAR